MKLFLRQYGQGFPVIILHGLFGMSDNWVSFGRRLSRDFNVIIPDLRNHGQSPHSPVFDFPSMEQDILELLDERGIQEADLIGHSLGGKVAMLIAMNHPERVRKLVIVDIGPRSYPENHEHMDLLNAMMSVDPAKAHSRSDIEKELKQYISGEKLRQFLLKNVYWKSPSQLGWRLNLSGIHSNLLRIFQSVEGAEPFTKQALFIRGGRSEYISDQDIPDIQKKFPRASIRTIEPASHWVHADEPEKFYDLVTEFLLGS